MSDQNWPSDSWLKKYRAAVAKVNAMVESDDPNNRPTADDLREAQAELNKLMTELSAE